MTVAHPDDRRAAPPRVQPWLKLAALVLVLAALGLPVNDLFRYALLAIATVLLVAGTVSARVAPWLGALPAFPWRGALAALDQKQEPHGASGETGSRGCRWTNTSPALRRTLVPSSSMSISPEITVA